MRTHRESLLNAIKFLNSIHYKRWVCQLHLDWLAGAYNDDAVFILLFKPVFGLVVCSCGTRSGQMETSRWCTVPVCGSSTGATLSSPNLMLTTVCCLCLESTWVLTTLHLGKSLSSVWVGTEKNVLNDSTVLFGSHSIAVWVFFPLQMHSLHLQSTQSPSLCFSCIRPYK